MLVQPRIKKTLVFLSIGHFTKQTGAQHGEGYFLVPSFTGQSRIHRAAERGRGEMPTPCIVVLQDLLRQRKKAMNQQFVPMAFTWSFLCKREGKLKMTQGIV